MTGLNHATTGIVIALVFKRPELAIPLSLLSHFLLDMIPHSFVPLKRKKLSTSYLFIETVLMLTITVVCMVAFNDMWLLIGTCAVVAFLPDFFWPFYYNEKLRHVPGFRSFYIFHKRIQWSETYRGWLVEALYFSVLVIFLATHST